jgi:hypothetical protein
MKAFLPVLIGALALGAAACRGMLREDISPEVEQTFQEADTRARESRTLSGLAKLEEGLSDYVKAEKKIPKRLEDLIPKYLAEMPTVELPVRGHQDTARVEVYPPEVLRDGRVDGSRLKDTGRWGYVFNDRQVVVFVDCTHKSGRGPAWYQERGVN